jgi:hypothetical protein
MCADGKTRLPGKKSWLSAYHLFLPNAVYRSRALAIPPAHNPVEKRAQVARAPPVSGHQRGPLVLDGAGYGARDGAYSDRRETGGDPTVSSWMTVYHRQGTSDGGGDKILSLVSFCRHRRRFKPAPAVSGVLYPLIYGSESVDFPRSSSCTHPPSNSIAMAHESCFCALTILLSCPHADSFQLLQVFPNVLLLVRSDITHTKIGNWSGLISLSRKASELCVSQAVDSRPRLT